MTRRIESKGHVFGRQRPHAGGRHPIHVTPDRDTHFRDLPDPTGQPPFHLDIKTIIPDADYEDIVAKKKLTFHVNGDMGGIKYDVPQHLVAKGMENDFSEGAAASDTPAFLYIAGDCVYFNGQVEEYYAQFYQPYEYYPKPIFAVPGNHDGENLPDDDTLKGFVRNFCAPTPIHREEALSSHRTAMIQPNVYWTLMTPLVNIVGLYSNVPEGGEIKEPQTTWLTGQLRDLSTELPLIVALHHPIYSADTFHAGSSLMRQALADAAQAAGRYPDLVLAGHVHDYQRFTAKRSNGTLVPFIVAGAGGYHNLHTIQKVNGHKMATPVNFDVGDGETVTLERYSDDHHGFLRMEVTDKLIIGKYFQVPLPHDPPELPNQLVDYWEFDWKEKQYVPNQL